MRVSLNFEVKKLVPRATRLSPSSRESRRAVFGNKFRS
jgi:hypothetical protein